MAYIVKEVRTVSQFMIRLHTCNYMQMLKLMFMQISSRKSLKYKRHTLLTLETIYKRPDSKYIQIISVVYSYCQYLDQPIAVR